MKNEFLLGKMSAKKDDNSIGSKKASPMLMMGATTGSVGKGLPLTLNAGVKKPLMGFPLKGRKAFVCPQKITESHKDS